MDVMSARGRNGFDVPLEPHEGDGADQGSNPCVSTDEPGHTDEPEPGLYDMYPASWRG